MAVGNAEGVISPNYNPMISLGFILYHLLNVSYTRQSPSIY